MVVASASPPLLSIILLISSVRFSTGQPSSPSAITFLTYRPSLETIRFALQLAQDIPSVDVHVVVDDNNFSFLQPNSSLLRFLLFNETVCNQSDFHGSNIAGIKRACSAWDKALYFFARIALHYRFVWFIEDDVFIPSTRAFLAIHQLYSSTNDLVIPAVQYILDGNIRRWDHAHLLANEFPLPWLKGMVAGVGLSRRLLSAVDEHVRWRGHLPFIEFLFPILAFRDEQMKIVSPPELAKIVYRTSYSFEQILAAPNDWWHPVKIVDQRQQWRQE